MRMLNLIPMPNHIEKIKGKLSFSNYQIVIEKKYEKAVLLLNQELEARLKIAENAFCYTFEFVFNKELEEEEYLIHMDQDLTHIEGGSEKAFFYATRTLTQILKLKDNKQVSVLTAPAYYIEDKPRFAHRSLMLDEVRHFFGMEEVKKIICVLSDLKINFFHWHLSDDQGFRIDFQTFPELKNVASKRSKTKVNSQDNDEWDDNEYQKYYTYHEIKDILRFAKERYVEIIPEIDLPGHTSAIVAAYPFLHCRNEKHEVRGDFGVFKEIMCPGKDTTYEFTKKLMDELCKLFKDSRYIHIGGDEVNHENYQKCPDCQKKMKEFNLSSTNHLQAHFSNEIAKYIMDTTNKSVIMWHDGIFENTDPRIILQYWDYKMDQERIQFINDGRPTIYSPCSQFYFNDPYGELPLIRSYNKGIHLTGLNRKAYKNIKGMECCIWTEWIDNPEMLEFNLNPRLFAFAEASWTYTIHHDFTNFVERIEHMNSFYKYYHLTHASKKIYLAYGNSYRKNISNSYRGTQKEIELDLSKKRKKMEK